jgi:hypothetical protein
MDKQFTEVLFRPGENIFVGGLYDRVSSNTQEFFAVNPLKPGCSRADANVSMFRNFLFEFDTLRVGPREQLEYIRALGIPYSTAVWSGNKSVHAIISLDIDVGPDMWRIIAARLKGFAGSDSSTMNPSRLSRAPGFIRSNGKLQELLDVRANINFSELAEWMEKNVPTVRVREHTPVIPRVVPRWVQRFIDDGTLVNASRTQTLFACSCALAEADFTLEEAFEMLKTRIDNLYNKGEYYGSKAKDTVSGAFRYTKRK